MSVSTERLKGPDGLNAMSLLAEFDSDDPDGFEAELLSVQLGAVRIDALITTGCIARRSPEKIVSAPADMLQLMIARSGEVITSQCGRTAGIVAGELLFVRSGVAFTSAYLPGDAPEDRTSVIQTTIPMTLLPGRERAVSALSSTVLPSTPLVLATAAFLTAFVEAAPGPGSAALRFAEHAIVDLALAIIADIDIDIDPGALAPESVEAGTRMRIREYMLRRLRDQEMTPPAIAAAFGISTRYLHRLFEGEGSTVAAFVKNKRLELAAAQLMDPTQARTNVAEIATRSGFASLNTFGRAFKERYAMTPLQMRADHPARVSDYVG